MAKVQSPEGAPVDEANLQVRIPADLREAIGYKSKKMGVSMLILTRAILEAWFLKWGKQEIRIGEVDATIALPSIPKIE